MRSRYESLAINVERLLRWHYSYMQLRREQVGVAVHRLHDTISSVIDDAGFLAHLQSSLSNIEDVHLRIVTAGGKACQPFRTSVRQNYRRELARQYLDELLMESGPIVYGMVNGAVYLSCESLHNRYAEHYVRLFEQRAPENDKFIVDLRANGGGGESHLKPLSSFLLGDGDRTVSHYIRRRTNRDDPSVLTDFLPLYVEPDKDSWRRKVVVLVGQATCSSAESTAMDLAAIPGATVVGDPSGGSSGCPQRYLLDGPCACRKVGYDDSLQQYDATFALDIPSWLNYRSDKVLLEQNGVVPHVRIPADETFQDGRDLVLEQAILLCK